MGEYQEDDDFNDLLESDEEEDGKDQKQTVEKENLLSLDDVVISEGTGGDYKSKTKTLDFMFLPETLDDDDDEDDNSTTDTRDSKNEENFKLELEKRRHFQRLLHSVPPGIDLFR